MKCLRLLALAALVAALLVTSAAAQGHGTVDAQSNGISISGGYAVTSGPAAPTAAAYMMITNGNAEPDRLIAVEGAAARRIELHAHVLEDGIARMTALKQGVDLPAGATVALQRNGLHVMLMGLGQPLEPGAELPLTLVFERAGRIALNLPVASAGSGRAPGAPDE